jgi:hypothetical protein
VRKQINGVEYEKYDDWGEYKHHFWRPVQDGRDRMICDCGNNTFTIFFPESYCTRGKCTACGSEEDIHTG